MREKVVYFIGAGFSAPLGLPVMSNFLIKSKDLYFSEPKKYSRFSKVFEVIDALSKAKNYYAVDLFNIEEILSLLEMEDHVGTTSHKQIFLEYLRDVIIGSTPQFKGVNDADRKGAHFSSDDLIEKYSAFVASLFGLLLPRDDSLSSVTSERLESAADYGIISLNYDLVLEKALDMVVCRLRGIDRRPKFAVSLDEATANSGQVPLAKLHGSVEPLTIVPPTWNKVANEKVKQAWQLAYKMLADATQIRFLGYSLPISDTYIRYLLESAVIKSGHLKAIDVICLDGSSSEVERRYRELITFYRLRFRSGNIVRYLDAARGRGRENVVSFDNLESVHEYMIANDAL